MTSMAARRGPPPWPPRMAAPRRAVSHEAVRGCSTAAACVCHSAAPHGRPSGFGLAARERAAQPVLRLSSGPGRCRECAPRDPGSCVPVVRLASAWLQVRVRNQCPDPRLPPRVRKARPGRRRAGRGPAPGACAQPRSRVAVLSLTARRTQCTLGSRTAAVPSTIALAYTRGADSHREAREQARDRFGWVVR